MPGTESSEEGLALKGEFWGKGKQAQTPRGIGRESAELWFGKM